MDRWDGANCNNMLKKLDKLEQDVPSSLVPFIETLKCFRNVVDSCFGAHLKEGYKENVKKFQDSFLALQELASSVFGTELTVTWKIHTIFNHIVPFCEIQEWGLGKFAEQAGIELMNEQKYCNIAYFVRL